MEDRIPTKRTVYIAGTSDQAAVIYDGEDGLGDRDHFALNFLGGFDVYLSRKDWLKIQRAVNDYFDEMEEMEEMEAQDE